MILSNEPGYYKKNKFGIRIENLVFVKKISNKLFFENLTLAPIEKDLINFNMLTQIDLYFNQCNMINDADMMKDCYLLAKDDFLNKYRWISEEEYNASLERFKFE